MEDALSYMFGGGDAAWMIRDGGVISAATGVTMTKNVSSDRTKNNACEVAIIVIILCFRVDYELEEYHSEQQGTFSLCFPAVPLDVSIST